MPTVFCVMPFYGNPVPGAMKAKYGGATDGRLQLVHHEVSTSSPPHTMDLCWSAALDARHRIPGGIDLLAMLHQDAIPERFWLDRLYEDLVRLDADVISVVMPIKNEEGISSTGVDDHLGRRKRFTMHELPGLPAVFDAAAAGFPGAKLLVNTGVMLVDLRKPWVGQRDSAGNLKISFHHHTGIRWTPEGGPHGRHVPWLEPEDWLFSIAVQDAGGKVYASRRVKASHKGEWDFTNWDAWGTVPSDPDYPGQPEPRPPSPDALWHFYQHIPGWFDDNYRVLYQQVAARALDGDVFVEVGSWLGRSTAFLAVELANSGKQATLHAVDTWKGSQSEPEQQAFVRQHGDSILHLFNRNMLRGGVENVKAVQARSVEAAKEYADGQAAFVFIDGDHAAPAVAADLKAWWGKVRPDGGTMAGHDYNYDSVKASVDAFFGALDVPVEDRVTCWLVRKPAAT